ncbi:MAG TPA: hypothetical protein VFZ79_09250 [Acidimicrobiales bacterium]
MTSERFEATFTLGIDRTTAWRRLTEHRVGGAGAGAGEGPAGTEAAGAEPPERCWLPGFDATATITDRADGSRLRATKDDEPCRGTDIVVSLTDAEEGTRITVVQSGFGDWLPARYDLMAIGWRHIVADLQAYLATGVHARRHLRPWGDLGASATPGAGGLRIGRVRAGTLAARLGLAEGDLLVVLAGAPVASDDDLVTVLRVLRGRPGPITAEWVRGGALVTASASSA